MPLSTQSQPDEENVFVASLDNARNLSNILKAIAFKDHAIFSATPNGLKVTVEDSKCLQANAFIQVCFYIIYYLLYMWNCSLTRNEMLLEVTEMQRIFFRLTSFKSSL